MRLRWFALLLCTVLLLGACSKPPLPTNPPEPTPTPPPVEEIVDVKPTEPSFPAVQVPPVNESGQDPALSAYWGELKEAVATKDAASLMQLLDPAIKNSFGGNDGTTAFKETWKPEQADSELWPLLTQIIQMGGTFRNEERTMFAAPYVYTRFPGDQFDAFQHLVIVGEDVPVRVEPKADAGVIDRVSHLIVRIKQYRPEEAWTQVILPTGQVGYVTTNSVWSPVGYRAGFHKTPDGWKMSFLLAGD